MLVMSRFSTTSTAMACQAVGTAADLEFTVASNYLLFRFDPRQWADKRVANLLSLKDPRIRNANEAARL